jgi:hypothetical protein
VPDALGKADPVHLAGRPQVDGDGARFGGDPRAGGEVLGQLPVEPRRVDLRDDPDVALLAEGDEAADLVLGLVAPGVGLGVGVALDLQFQQELVELVVRHVADRVLQPLGGDVDVAGADADAAFGVAGHVDRAGGGHAVAPREELQQGAGAVEGARAGPPGDRQVPVRAQFVALGAERRAGGADADNDVARACAAADDEDAAVAGARRSPARVRATSTASWSPATMRLPEPKR